MVLGAYIITPDFEGMGAVYLPLVLAAVGIIMSIIGTFFVKVKDRVFALFIFDASFLKRAEFDLFPVVWSCPEGRKSFSFSKSEYIGN